MVKPLLTLSKLFAVFLVGVVFSISSLSVSHATPLYSASNSDVAATTSRNWAGYVATGSNYTVVRGTWVVPTVSSNRVGIDATWVGIGGAQSQDLIQSGTQATVTRVGGINYQAWIEMLPAASQPIPVAIHAGDTVTVAITELSTNQWQISFTDNTSGQQYQTNVQYASSLSSAEWVEEAPSGRYLVLPLDNFGTVQFSNGFAVENGNQVSIAQAGGQPETMLNVVRQPIAVPSALTSDGTGFSVTRVSTILPLTNPSSTQVHVRLPIRTRHPQA